MATRCGTSSKTAEVAPGPEGRLLPLRQPARPEPRAGGVAGRSTTTRVTHFCESGNPGSTSLRMGVGGGLARRLRQVARLPVGRRVEDLARDLPRRELTPTRTTRSGRATAPPRPTSRAFASAAGDRPRVRRQAGDGGRRPAAPRRSRSRPRPFGAPGTAPASRSSRPRPTATSSQTAGRLFTGPAVTYTPAPGYTGPDSFTYVARDADSEFPTSRLRADRDRLDPGAGARRSRSPARPPASWPAPARSSRRPSSDLSGGVTWSTTAGTISPTGLLVAPAAPPAGGTLTVRATSDSPARRSAPRPSSPSPRRRWRSPRRCPRRSRPCDHDGAGTKLLSRLTAGHAGRRDRVGTVTTGPKAGRVDMIVTFSGTVLGRCGARRRRAQDGLLQDHAHARLPAQRRSASPPSSPCAAPRAPCAAPSSPPSAAGASGAFVLTGDAGHLVACRRRGHASDTAAQR